MTQPLSSEPKDFPSDESRYIKETPNLGRAIGIGGLGGLVYAFLEWWFDYFGETSAPPLLRLMHDLFDWIIPVALGVVAGFGFYLWQRLRSSHQILSTQNAHLKSHLLTHTIFSHILHEIRNPIHNLSAVLDDSSLESVSGDREIIQRNLKRLTSVTDQLKRMSAVTDSINPNQPVLFKDWMGRFLEQSVFPTIRQRKIRYEDVLEPVIVHMHPLLLEQCLTILFQNAITAAEKGAFHKSLIRLTASYDHAAHGYAVIRLFNSGLIFSEEVLRSAGRYAVKSTQGMGFGLVLVRDSVESVGGTMQLTNEQGMAIVTLRIPAEKLL